MKPEIRYTTNGKVSRTGDMYEVTFPRAGGKRVVTSRFDFTRHRLREAVRRFVLGDAEGVSAGTIRGRCYAAKFLGEFLEADGSHDLTPETYRAFLRWLENETRPNGTKRFGENAVDTYAILVLAFYASGLEGSTAGWTRRNLDLMSECRAHQSRGSRQRQYQRSVDAAVSERAFNDLARAVALEFEECEQALAAYHAGERSHLQVPGRGLECLDPNPFVVFALQAAMRMGLRASEFNALGPDDICRDPERSNHEIYVHAPNKADDFIPVDDVFIRSLDLCLAWQEAARGEKMGEGCVWPSALLVYLSTDPMMQGSPVVLHTGLLNEVHLPYFYAKYFGVRVPTKNGSDRPLLHAEEDPDQPFWLSFAKIRNSFAVRLSEQEADIGVVQQVMRHQAFRTTHSYYLHRRKNDHARKTAVALESEARLLVLGLTRPAIVGVSDETVARAREAGALVPHGYCKSTLEGQGCIFPGDCLECKQLRVIESRLPRLGTDRDVYLAKAAALEEIGDSRAAENRRRLAARAQAYIYAVEDRQAGSHP